MVTNLLGLLLLVGLCGLDGVLPMVPSDAAVLTAGALGHADPARMLLIVAATALGVFIGDHLAYGISRSLLGTWLVGRSARLGRAVSAVQARLERRAGPLIVASRFVPGGRVTVNVACGTARLPLRRFSPASAVAALAWAVYITGLGYLGGAAFAGNPLLGIAAGFGLSLAFGGVVELIRRRAARRRDDPAPAAAPSPSPCPVLACRPRQMRTQPVGDGVEQLGVHRPAQQPTVGA